MDRPQLVHIGHHVIPNALAQEMKVYAFQHDGYWHVSWGRALEGAPARSCRHARWRAFRCKGLRLSPAGRIPLRCCCIRF